MTNGDYSSPKVYIISIMTEMSILIASPVIMESKIKDPNWSTSGDYGLE